jgi:ribosomal protein L18E
MGGWDKVIHLFSFLKSSASSRSAAVGGKDFSQLLRQPEFKRKNLYLLKIKKFWQGGKSNFVVFAEKS